MVEHDPVFELHRGGKMAVQATVPLSSREDLSMAYTPGVARVCEAIAADPSLAREYTWTGHTVAVVTDGSAVLGLGNIGPRAAMPVMEGKAVLFKQFGGVDAVPVCLDTQDTDEIIRVVTALAPSFGGINLEDIAAPRCFEIERRLDVGHSVGPRIVGHELVVPAQPPARTVGPLDPLDDEKLGPGAEAGEHHLAGSDPPAPPGQHPIPVPQCGRHRRASDEDRYQARHHPYPSRSRVGYEDHRKRHLVRRKGARRCDCRAC